MKEINQIYLRPNNLTDFHKKVISELMDKKGFATSTRALLEIIEGYYYQQEEIKKLKKEIESEKSKNMNNQKTLNYLQTTINNYFLVKNNLDSIEKELIESLLV